MTDDARPAYRDRNTNYVPDSLYLDGRLQSVEISPHRPDLALIDPAGHLAENAWNLIANTGEGIWETQTPEWQAAAARWRDSYHHALERAQRAPAKTARVTFGRADELNREHHGSWDWADVSGDGTHWSHFRGHRIQVDIAFHTWNRREINDWKGRDEIRPSGEWTLSLNRQQVWEGHLGGDNPLAALARIESVARRLIDHGALNWTDPRPLQDQLAGRRVYYDRTPAVVSYTSTLHQGCVGLKPVGVDQFPPSMYEVDRGDEDRDPYDRDEIKVDLLDPHIHWWRDRLVEGVETDEKAVTA